MGNSPHGDASKHDARPVPASGPDGEHAAEGDALFVGVGAICDTAARLTGVDGAALAVLAASHGVRELVYATDALAQQIDELQFVMGEGPCLDAYRGDHAELWPRIDDSVFESRWPGFTAELLDLGVAAVFAFPVPGRPRPMGVLELYRRSSGGLDEREQQSARVCAAALRDTLQSNWRTHLSRSSSEEAAMEAAVTHGAVVPPSDPFSRSQVYVAAGMVAVQLAVTAQDGLDRLRAYSYANKRPINAVAADVVQRRLSFSDLEVERGADS
jgi:hypothetical protein